MPCYTLTWKIFVEFKDAYLNVSVQMKSINVRNCNESRNKQAIHQTNNILYKYDIFHYYWTMNNKRERGINTFDQFSSENLSIYQIHCLWDFAPVRKNAVYDSNKNRSVQWRIFRPSQPLLVIAQYKARLEQIVLIICRAVFPGRYWIVKPDN